MHLLLKFISVVCVALVFLPTHSLAYNRTEEIITSYGYPVETHIVTTSDGYDIHLIRIPYSPKLKNKDKLKQPVLLQHGILSNSDSWVVGGPEYSLGFLLADAGYDVWLGNQRGNNYSRDKTKPKKNSGKFWTFGLHEIGSIDLPTMIDHILLKSARKTLHYVGHSQGTSVYFILMATQPEYRDKILSGHLLAPCVYFPKPAYFLLDFFDNLLKTPGSIRTRLFKNKPFTPYNPQIVNALGKACRGVSRLGACRNFFTLFTGGPKSQTNITAFNDLLKSHPAGACTNQGLQFLQSYQSGEFKQLDHGRVENLVRYRRTTPPKYDLSKVSEHTYSYASEGDTLCTMAGLDMLMAELPEIMQDYRVKDTEFSHVDFILGNNVNEYINRLLISNLQNYQRS